MTDVLMSRVLGLELWRVREHGRIELDEHNQGFMLMTPRG